ncbi:MAG: hypothetical protein KDB95_14460 [Flavobacteriales bacterium]|nr:hypothetical protein [Flavobacteriales bacterium]MCB9163744.1 hypothetical protein [Flavobacteriales bacterium]
MSTTELRNKIRSLLEKESNEVVLLRISEILEQAEQEERLSVIMTARVAEAQAEYRSGRGIPAEEVLRRIKEDMRK